MKALKVLSAWALTLCIACSTMVGSLSALDYDEYSEKNSQKVTVKIISYTIVIIEDHEVTLGKIY